VADLENDNEATDRDEASDEPRAKKFKYTSKAKPEAAASSSKASSKADEDDDDDSPAEAPGSSDSEDEERDEDGDQDDERDEDTSETDDDSDAEEEAEAAPKENRAARRKKKKVKDGAESKDRNEKIRKQLLKKKLAAEEEPEALTAGEMMDDALARGVAATGKWLKRNSVAVQYVLLAALVGGVGFGIYAYFTGTKAEAASGLLASAVHADRGVVDADPPPQKPGEEQVVAVYKTEKERADAALAGYRAAEAAAKGSGAGILARLGEAGVLLDTKQYDAAIAAYREVKGSPLGAADPDVLGRAVEGIGFALEGKGDKDGALGAFKEMESMSARGFKELGMYHQARLLAGKGEKDKALALIKAARDRIRTDPRGFAYVDGVLEELNKTLDPEGAAKAKGGMGLDQVLKLQEMMKKTQGDE
jgi:hypothetical protein